MHSGFTCFVASSRVWALAPGVVALAVAGAVLGCSDDDERPAGIGDCEGAYCSNPNGGGSTTTTDAGTDAATDADAEVEATVVDLSGTIVRLADDQFATPLTFDGSGYIRYPTPSQDEQVNFDAASGFAATGVVTGDGWFTVVPDASLFDSGLVSVMTTYSYLPVPEEGSTDFEIPVLDRTLLSTLYMGFVQPTTVRADAAQVVVVFESNGQRVPGVQVLSYPTAEALAYDVGAGLSTDAIETGNAGVALLVNVTGTSSLAWESGEETGSLSVVQVPGQASFVQIEVP